MRDAMIHPSGETLSPDVAERLARRRDRLVAPRRRAAPVEPIAMDAAAVPHPGHVVLWDEVVWGAVAPNLRVAPAKAIRLPCLRRGRAALRGTVASTASVH